MSRATLKTTDLAARLISHEMKNHQPAGEKTPAVFRACAKLRSPMATLMGRAGFRALLSRALALATETTPRLRAVTVRTDGSLEGWVEGPTPADSREFRDDSVALVAQLLGLLVAFIGEKLTLQIVREAWPKLPPTPFDAGKRKNK